jgi:NIMA (never in mitosis gene a)-related kinase
MKTIEISQLNEEQKKEALQEAKILRKLDHPNIIRLKEVFIAKKPRETLNIITEYADGEDLSKKIKHNLKMNQKFPEDKILDWFTQICLAVYYIQKNKILHRDIKPQNVFLTKSSMVKLGDFGISKNLNTTWEKAVTFIGTPYYISPEIVQNQPYSFKSDIWSLGVLLYELIALKYPFDASSLPKLMIKIMKGQYMKIKDKNFSTELKNLVYMILNVNPDKRPGIKDILDMPIMKNRSAILLKEVEYDKKITDKYIKDFVKIYFYNILDK